MNLVKAIHRETKFHVEIDVSSLPWRDDSNGVVVYAVCVYVAYYCCCCVVAVSMCFADVVLVVLCCPALLSPWL